MDCVDGSQLPWHEEIAPALASLFIVVVSYVQKLLIIYIFLSKLYIWIVFNSISQNIGY